MNSKRMVASGLGFAVVAGIIWLSAASRGVPGVALAAQVDDIKGASSPIAIRTTWLRPAESSHVVELELTNTSARKIKAYVLRVQTYGGDGTQAMLYHHVVIPGLGDPGARNSFAPAESWPSPIKIASDGVHEPEYAISVDHVRFAPTEDKDAKQDWGPDERQFSHQIVGAMGAARAVRGRLKRLYESRGVQAVVDDLMTQEQ